MLDPNEGLELKDYITIVLSISAFIVSMYNTMVLSRRGFKLNTFNAVITLNKEFNEHFKNYHERSKKIFEVDRTVTLKRTKLNEKQHTQELDDSKRKDIEKEIKELIIEIKDLDDDCSNLLSERKMDVENCMNIMDILYFGVFKLNILSKELKYNFYKLASHAVLSFEEAGYGWVVTDYEEVTSLLKSWKASDKMEKQLDINSLNKDIVFLTHSINNSSLYFYSITKKLSELYLIRILFFTAIGILILLGLFSLCVILNIIL